MGFIRSDLSSVYNCMVLVGLTQDWVCWVTCNVEIKLINSFTGSDLRLISVIPPLIYNYFCICFSSRKKDDKREKSLSPLSKRMALMDPNHDGEGTQYRIAIVKNFLKRTFRNVYFFLYQI